MSLDEIFAQIEDVSFSAYFNAASGLSTFLLGLENDQTIHELIGQLSKSEENQKQVLERLLHLVSDDFPSDYSNPYDVAIASYLYALSSANSYVLQDEILSVLNSEQLWWAKKLGKHIQQKINPIYFLHDPASLPDFTTTSGSYNLAFETPGFDVSYGRPIFDISSRAANRFSEADDRFSPKMKSANHLEKIS